MKQGFIFHNYKSFRKFINSRVGYNKFTDIEDLNNNDILWVTFVNNEYQNWCHINNRCYYCNSLKICDYHTKKTPFVDVRAEKLKRLTK